MAGEKVVPKGIPDVGAKAVPDTLTDEGMTSTTSEVPSFTQSEIAWDGYFESMAVLALLLALLWGCFWAARRYGLFSMMPRAANIHRDALRLEGQLSLGPRKGIMVVRCLEKRLVLGVTDQNISLLTELAVEDDGAHASESTPNFTHDSRKDTPTTPASQKTPPDSKLVQKFTTLLQGKNTL